MINIWEEHIPKDVKFFNSNNIDQCSKQIFNKKISMVKLDEDVNMTSTQISTDVLSLLTKNIKQNCHKINAGIFKKLINIENINTVNLYQLSNNKQYFAITNKYIFS